MCNVRCGITQGDWQYNRPGRLSPPFSGYVADSGSPRPQQPTAMMSRQRNGSGRRWATSGVLFLLLASLQCTWGLRLTKVTIPAYKIRGEMVHLECGHELEGDRLYSVKWYKDNEEFYRYVPRAVPHQHSYKVDGVRVDHGQSDSTKVFLRSVSLKSSGVYRCEVSAEAPSFSSASGEGRMEVVYLPKEDPRIGGEDKSYQAGEIINLNCTASKSYPPATLRWYVNDRPADPSWVIAKEPAAHGPHGLTASAIGLRFQVQPHHFLPQGGGGPEGRGGGGGERAIRIRCVATISALFWEGERSVVESRQQLQGQGGAPRAAERASHQAAASDAAPADFAPDTASAALSPVIDNRETLLLVRGSAGLLKGAPGLLIFCVLLCLSVASSPSLPVSRLSKGILNHT
ncbi:uncharacterized protein LOC124155724 [Ischnura elegans]|uniref:uncharacterized protein LOC124155724 n=1 Tax=Ischnura elegans TaxID=197161 RepID=UPI001ED86D4A|nr:uncharacterized protein LOC124155724 [Ischnura elegans]